MCKILLKVLPRAGKRQGERGVGDVDGGRGRRKEKHGVVGCHNENKSTVNNKQEQKLATETRVLVESYTASRLYTNQAE